MLEKKNQRLKFVEEEKTKLRKELLGKSREIEALKAAKGNRVSKRSNRPSANLENIRRPNPEVSKTQAKHPRQQSPMRPSKSHVKRSSMGHNRHSPVAEPVKPLRPKSSSRQHVRSQSENYAPNKRAPSR